MIKINQGLWLPFGARMVCYIIILFSVISLFGTPASWVTYLVSGCVLALSIAFAMARDYLEFRMHDNTYHPYVLVFGLKFGEKEKFDFIEKLFVNKINLVSGTNNYTPLVAPNLEFRNTVYKCFLKFGDGEKILLDSDKDKARLFDRLKKYNKILKTTLWDTTTNDAVIVE